jgi:DNA-binding response OmpR family regulator
VLVVEDEPNIAEAIRFILRRDGWAVETLDNGIAAQARIQAAPPDLVILDVMLPGQSGLDVFQALRLAPATAQLPVILLSARSQAVARDLAADGGASIFMSKPFANGELLAAVRQLVGV